MVVKDYNRRVADAGRIEKVQALTDADTATKVKNYGFTTIAQSTSGNKSFTLEAPRAGLRKTIIVDLPTTAVGTVTVALDSTGTDFLGSTANSVVFSTAATASAIDLIGISTSRWAVISQSAAAALT